jgi:hypothetical protein
MNIDQIMDQVKIKPMQTVADFLNVQVVDLRYLLTLEGTTAHKLKAQHAREVIAPLASTYTIVEMARLTGFSPRKVSNIVKMYGLRSKFSSWKRGS